MDDKRTSLPRSLATSSQPARLWEPLEGGRVQCHLSPRECKIPEGGLGFCGVRYNDGGRLVTLNYGKSVPMTQETIETEAVYHFAPGARILSMGNIGCMMKCDFCHNWQTSQARLARDQDIVAYSPEEVVDYALRHDIGVLSWTYNDPVVWHEFVVDTARLARRHGLLNLYKSAFYIGPQAVDELLEVIDIFSLSLKSMNPEHYRKHTGGTLQPVLDAILQVYRARGPHLELSNLCVTGRNDTLEESDAVARWILDHLDADVPLHYVRFHPDYQYTHVPRTSVPFLEEARRSAIAMGMRYVYVGNVYDTESVNTWCAGCGELLVRRYGLTAAVHLRDGACPRCALPAPIRTPALRTGGAPAGAGGAATDLVELHHQFRGAVQSIHIEQDTESPVTYQFVDGAGAPVGEPAASSCRRFMISKAYPEAAGVRVTHAAGRAPRVYEVFDRAHFPTVDLATAVAATDERPLPLHTRRPRP